MFTSDSCFRLVAFAETSDGRLVTLGLVGGHGVERLTGQVVTAGADRP